MFFHEVEKVILFKWTQPESMKIQGRFIAFSTTLSRISGICSQILDSFFILLLTLKKQLKKTKTKSLELVKSGDLSNLGKPSHR